MKSVRLSDVATIEVGLPFRSADFSRDEGDVRLLRGDNVSQGRLDWAGAARWPASAPVDVKYAMNVGDVVLAMDRPWVGAGLKRARVRSDDIPSYLVQRVARLRAKAGLDQGYLGFVVDGASFSDYLLAVQTGTAIPHISGSQIGGYRFDLPPLPEQQAIAEVLGALDDKIAANAALAATAAAVARLEMRAAVRDDARELTVDEASVVLVRGITPRYLPDGEGTRVLNQKCVRDQVVSLGPSRWTDDSKVRAEKVLAVGDILVNSTGQGTLGRVARWTLPGQATVDSHITIVRPDPNVSDPTVIGQAVLAIEADIEALGEGSTGQTELSRVELGRTRIRVPSSERANRVGQTLRALAASQDAVRAENATLAATRDALLPQLMSGKLRVRDAQKVAQEAGL